MPSLDNLISLDRLAADTGGRYTERSNDLSLGYARAQRDLGCVYTLGFYDDEVVEEEIRSIKILVRRPGLQALHPASYMVRSPQGRRESLLRAAWMAPALFQTGIVRAHLFPLRPATAKTWVGLLAVSFAVPLGETAGADARREFGAVLRRRLGTGSEIAHRFERTVSLRPDGPEVKSAPVVTFLEPVTVPPGAYVLTAVMSEVGRGTPHAVEVPIEVPEIPRKREAFLVGPILAQRAGTNVVVLGGSLAASGDRVGGADSFQPLLVQRVDEPVDLALLTEVCAVGTAKRPPRAGQRSVHRALADGAGTVLGALEPLDLAFEGEGAVRCQNLLDVVPAASQRNGEYSFDVELHSAEGVKSGSVRFSIGSAAPGSTP